MGTIREPIVAAEERNLYFFHDIVDAQLAIEIVDVKSGEFVFFDASGRRLMPRVQGDRVELVDSGQHDEMAERADLEARLRGWLTHFGPRPAEAASLDDLLSACEPYFFKSPRSPLQVVTDFIRRRILQRR